MGRAGEHMELYQIQIANHLCIYTWALAYSAMIYRGFKDQSYGMPIVALTLNLSWEIIFSLIIPPYGSADAALVPYGGAKAQIVFALWAVLDLVILYTFFRFGYKYFAKSYGITRGQWIGFTVVMLVFSFLVILTGAKFFMQFDTYFNRDQIEAAKVIAFAQNALMSVSFVAMFYARGGSMEGQSFTIAWAKWIGSSMTTGLIYILGRPGEWYFVGTFIAMIFVADVYYMVITYRALRRQGINPWTRL